MPARPGWLFISNNQKQRLSIWSPVTALMLLDELHLKSFYQISTLQGSKNLDDAAKRMPYRSV